MGLGWYNDGLVQERHTGVMSFFALAHPYVSWYILPVHLNNVSMIYNT